MPIGDVIDDVILMMSQSSSKSSHSETWTWITVVHTESALAAACDIHRQMPTYMPDIRRDWLTNQNMDWCFVVIGLVGRQTHSPLLPLKMDPVHQMGLPYWLAPSGCQRIFINIRGQ